MFTPKKLKRLSFALLLLILVLVIQWYGWKPLVLLVILFLAGYIFAEANNDIDVTEDL